MKTNFTLSVPTPCHENWAEFIPTQKGRFCGSCQKEVIDFTRWSEEQIKQYFIYHTSLTCGRFALQQLKPYTSTTASKPHARWAACIAFLLLLINRPSEAQPSTQQTLQEQVDKKQVGTQPTDFLIYTTLTGTVRSVDDGYPLPGVNVIRKGTMQGTITDADGKFKFEISHPKQTETLVFSFIGMTTLELEVPIQSTTKDIVALMKYDVVGLSELVVVGGVVSVRRFSPRNLWWKLKNVFRR